MPRGLWLWPESLFVVRHGEEASNGEKVRAGVHQDEEEDAGGIQARQLRIVRHDPVQQDRHLLH